MIKAEIKRMPEEKRFKIEIFIPETHFEEFRKALQSVDAGHIGNYDCCLSYSRVIGTWRPLAGTDPYIGEAGKISEEEEPVINVIELYRTGIYGVQNDQRRLL